MDKTEIICKAYMGYVEEMLWAETDTDADSPTYDQSLEDRGMSAWNLTPAAVEATMQDVAKMVTLAIEDEQTPMWEEYDWRVFGADLYFTRQGHGVGYWDDSNGLHYKGDGKRLDELCEQNFHEIYTWINDNGQVEVE